MFSNEIAGELGSRCEEITVNNLAEGRFGGEAMKESCQCRKRGLMVGAVCLMQP